MMNPTSRRKLDADKPLQGAIICCTSLPPEERSNLSQIVQELGGKLYLDLTSDVTHLLVGQVSTPKYKYVAREREDIKVLRPEFIYAVRDAWTLGGTLDFDTLEETFRWSTFAGLSICVTGFDDLGFRTQLQEVIQSNGGSYKGDLTKAVTHLIAKTAEGKKYQYAQQWQITTVSLKWLKDSLDRGLILDESLYHPTMSEDEQGKGAWNRKVADESHLGKRFREPDATTSAPRKLRRTASARLGSQSDAMWGDIVGGESSNTETEERNQLRHTKSMSDPSLMAQQSRSFATDTTTAHREHLVTEDQDPSAIIKKHGLMDDCVFMVAGFNEKQTAILRNTLTVNGADLVSYLSELNYGRYRYLLVPFSTKPESVPTVNRHESSINVVTDLWVEKCLYMKKLIEPTDYVPSRNLQHFPIQGFEKLIINSTTFEGIEVLHLSKLVSVLGAKYDEYFKPSISVLVAKTKQLSEDKLMHAYQWRIPVVSADWFWSCLRTGIFQPFKPYLVNIPSSIKAKIESMAREIHAKQEPKRVASILGDGLDSYGGGTTAVKDGDMTCLKKNASASVSKKPKPGTDFTEEGTPATKQEIICHEKGESSTRNAEEPVPTLDHENSQNSMPLREISTNSPPKSQTTAQGKPSIAPYDGTIDYSQKATDPETLSPGLYLSEPTQIVQPEAKTESINNAILDLLRRKKTTTTASTISMANSQGKKKRLLGRALSNLSNSSREGTTTRPSRASSIDSINTDGIGSVILDDASQASRPKNEGRRVAESGSRGFNETLTGRGSAKDSNVASEPLERDEQPYYEEPNVVEDSEPQMTQLGWDEPDESKQLREIMVDKKKKPGKTPQKGSAGDSQVQKKIRDDEALIGTKWGGGRRTRPKTRSPKRMEMIF